MIVDVKDFVKQEKEKIKKQSNEPIKRMLIIQVGDNPASNAYIKGKIKDAEELGHQAMLMKFPEWVSADMVLNFLKDNAKNYDGVILQEPANITEDHCFTKTKKQDIINFIEDWQDIDGFKKTSQYKPATPRGIVEFLNNYYEPHKNPGSDFMRNNLTGKVIAVVGKGKLVGEPLVPMLMKKGATVISCNSKTPDLGAMTRQADIVIAAAGVRGLIQNDMVEDGTLVIDAGINVDEDGKLCGDCSKDIYERRAVQITPVPGGVGLLTRLALMKNLLGK